MSNYVENNKTQRQMLVEDEKFLSYVLRHSPQEINLTLDNQGYCLVDELIDKIQQNTDKKHFNLDYLKQIVKASKKTKILYRRNK